MLPPGFRVLLSMRMTWERNIGNDLWGNEAYDPPVTNQPCFVTQNVSNFGEEDGHNLAEGETVERVEVLSDAIGVRVKDRLTLPGGRVVFVTSVDTPQDEQGNDLMHTITAETARKG